ncbi:hypothetical protein ACG1BZ_14635 [Microbulbifer sp. CNSA002]|uniref:hypothetical protein n=1 Tax=unclassified Microbulbifer TaxID=2619833 RepID=UPI0039B63120
MKIYVHIGSDKTGSTSIQSALSQNQNTLRAKGVEYPKLHKQDNHHESLVRELRTGKKGESWHRLSKVIASKPNHLILSAEAFCTLKKAEISRFKEWINHSDTNIIAYIRRADEYLESGTMQRLKSATSFNAFKRHYLIAKHLPALFDPYVYSAAFKTHFVKSWRAHYPTSMIIRPYNKQQWEMNDLISDFLYSISLGDTQEVIQTTQDSQNVTPGITGVYAISILTRNKLFELRRQLILSLAKDPQHAKKGALLGWGKRATAHILSRIYNLYTFDSKKIILPSNRIPNSIGLPKLSDVVTESENLIANQLAKTHKRRVRLWQELNVPKKQSDKKSKVN